MKKSVKNLALIICVFNACFFISSKLQAQVALNCPSYYVFNHRNCPIVIHYEVSDCIGFPCSGGGIICFNTNVVIPANTMIILPCCKANPAIPPYTITPSCPWAGGDVFVWLKKINGIDVTGGNNSRAVSRGNCLSSGGIFTTGPLPVGIPSPCNTPAFYTLTSSANGVDIN